MTTIKAFIFLASGLLAVACGEEGDGGDWTAGDAGLDGSPDGRPDGDAGVWTDVDAGDLGSDAALDDGSEMIDQGSEDQGDLGDTPDDSDPICTDDDLWWIWNLSVMPPRNEQICAFVRGEGERVVVVVEQSTWGHTVDEQAVANLLEAWDHATPADPERGLYQVVTGLFGQPPDTFDDDPRIYLLLYEMEGYGEYTFDGYFRVDDQSASSVSNRREMLHINTLEYDPDSDYLLSVQAHEFQHLVHWNHDRDEESWLNEAMSELAMVVTGFGTDEAWVSSWLHDPSATLMADSYSVHYGVLLLFGTYLYERLGAGFIADLVADEANGIGSLQPLLSAQQPAIQFGELLGDLALAIALDDPDYLDGRFGFDSLELDRVKASNLAAGTTIDANISAHGGFAFFRSIEDLSGRSLWLESSSYSDLAIRVAVDSSGGTELVAEELAGETVEIPLSDQAASGTILWVTVANPTTQQKSIRLRLE
ncbi:MAG: hypothetical protein JW797_07850 [Bradymonadales bacterium]|nr:hypothetical protein [Bradymonadales bacterium]